MAGRTAAKTVGRPREFDEDTVLEAAMGAFWEKGYEATSLADLCRCTGLHKGSLYQTFGDKHQLFMRSLERYAEEEFRKVAAVAFDSQSPIENLRAVVHKVCDVADEESGCLMINSMVELAPHDPDVKQFLLAAGEKRLRVMSEMIGKAQVAGEIRKELEPKKLARQLMVTLAGVATTSKGFLQQEEAVEVMDELIDSWT